MPASYSHVAEEWETVVTDWLRDMAQLERQNELMTLPHG